MFREMGTKALISPEEYLAMHFSEREPEYVRGELKEKPLPDILHGMIQMLFGTVLRRLIAFALVPASEVRCRVRADAYRLPDVALFHVADVRPGEIPSTPPLMITEIVSRDEKHVELIAMLRDYAAWGVPNIWIVDPWTRRLAVWRNDSDVPVDALSLPEYDFEVRLEQLMEGLPE
jgi:Uma2 family endonuclease